MTKPKEINIYSSDQVEQRKNFDMIKDSIHKMTEEEMRSFLEWHFMNVTLNQVFLNRKINDKEYETEKELSELFIRLGINIEIYKESLGFFKR